MVISSAMAPTSGSVDCIGWALQYGLVISLGPPEPFIKSIGDRRTVLTKTPASLPVGTVLINEIYNSDDLQWIELHNTGTAEVDAKKYMNWKPRLVPTLMTGYTATGLFNS